MSEIRLTSLAHSYDSSPTSAKDFALKEMNHVWEQGGAYALLGPSGCGKSTLLNIISGLLRPSHGKVYFDGEDVSNVGPEQRNVAQVFQFPVVYDTMTVYQNLAFPLKNLGQTKDSIDRRVREVSGALELDGVLSQKATNLTADEKQKVSMGRGLVREDVSAILLDEPLTVIDPNLKWKLRRQLKILHKQFNITMVLVTHDQLEASTFADKIALMYDGKIVQFGTPQELFEEPAHSFVGYFIGSPGMNFVDVSLREGHAEFDQVLVPIEANLYQAALNTRTTNIKLGIRPEFVKLHSQRCQGGLPARVVDVVDLGAHKIVDVALGRQRIKVKVEEELRVSDEEVFITFPEQRLKLYADDLLIRVEHS